jgi:outer membrane protein OmpA-like peptidoglycan-associated protein/tetratricopeptide (TPR) repeat protein
MKKNTSVLLFWFLSFQINILFSQSIGLTLADKKFDQFGYSEAIQKYENLIKRSDTTVHIAQRIADCYRLVNNTEIAEKWYGYLIKNKKENSPANIYYYSQALKSNGKAEEAKIWFEKYAEFVPSDSRPKRKSSFVDMAGDKARTRITDLEMNTPFSEFGAVYFKNGIVFASNRTLKEADQVKKQYNWNQQPYYDLYEAKITKNNDFEEVMPFAKELNSAFHEGPVCFESGDSTIYFTRNNYLEWRLKRDQFQINHLSLLVAKKVKDKDKEKWKEVKRIWFDNDSFSIGHPTLTSDGKKLFFASDMPGGYGGSDIYLSIKLDTGNWSRPINLGPKVNTEGNEMFPFIHDNGMLFYASNGLPGYGGLDIFYTSQNDKGWDDPKNIGEPFNSPKDDFSLTLNQAGYQGYFTSNRPGGKGDDDIYFFEILNAPPVANMDKVSAFAYEKKVNIDFMANDSDPDKDQLLVSGFSEVSQNGAKIDYDSITNKFIYNIPPNFTGLDTFSYTICDKIVFNQKCNSSKVIVTIQQGNFVLRGQVFLKDTTQKINTPMENVEIVLRDAGEFSLQEALTNNAGKFEFPLLPETDYKIRFKKTGYIIKYQEFTTKGKKPGIIEVVEYLEKLEIGKTFVLENLYYDLNKANIRPDAALVLNEVVKLMKENPSLKIELGSHTDCRASNSYNQNLSQRRAESAVKYIVSQGIKANRIKAKGYGESQLVNKCADGVKCTEEEHQKNRRTEVKIVSF